jgi:hypothetical protein
MNRECIVPGGAGIYPLTGDVTSTAGNALVVVTGIQGIPVSASLPSAGSVLQYSVAGNRWEPTPENAISSYITLNGTISSYDYEISVNVPKQVYVNGS